jgi:hypothetical protein
MPIENDLLHPKPDWPRSPQANSPRGWNGSPFKPGPEPDPLPYPALDAVRNPRPRREVQVPYMLGQQPRRPEVDLMSGLLEVIATGEGTAGKGGYDATFGYGKFLPKGWTKPPTVMTLDEWKSLQAQMLARGGGSPLGKYQIKRDTLIDLQRQLKLTGTEVMTPQFQDHLAVTLLNRKGFQDFREGKVSNDAMAQGIAKEWASVDDGRGSSRYANNKAFTSRESIDKALGAFKSSARPEPPPNYRW